MAKQEEKTRITRERIVKAGIELFGTLGYSDFTINHLCKDYAISKGLFYHNFSGKDELFLTCVNETYERLLQFLKINHSDLKNPEEYIALRLQFFKEKPLLRRIFFESFICDNEMIYEKLGTIRASLTEWNKKVYMKYISEIRLREDISKEDAIQYFEWIQRMINGYYSSPIWNKMDIAKLEEEYEAGLSKFLKYVILGISEI